MSISTGHILYVIISFISYNTEHFMIQYFRLDDSITIVGLRVKIIKKFTGGSKFSFLIMYEVTYYIPIIPNTE